MTAPASRLLLLTGVIAAIAVPAAAAKSPRLHPFRSCAELVTYARAHTTASTPQRTDQPVAPMPTTAAPAPSGSDDTARPKQESSAGTGTGSTEDASQTNVQEAGIDEPDVVKSDGKTLFAISGGTLYAVDARAATPTIVGSLKLEGSDHELLLHDGRLLVLGRGASAPPVGVIGRPGSRRQVRHRGRADLDADRAQRGRRARPGGHARRTDAARGRRLRQRAPEGRRRARGRLGRAVGGARRAGPDAGHAARPRGEQARDGAPARALHRRPPPGGLQRPRAPDRPDDRPRPRPAPRSTPTPS